jgi:hypothetical protein
LSCVAVFLLFCGCASKLPPQEATTAVHEAIRNRAESVFDQAQLYKPADVIDDPLVATLSPLLFLEVPTNAPVAPDVPGELGRIELEAGAATFSRFAPTLYYHANPLFLEGATHLQITFLWFHQARESSPTETARAQGVRITLDSQERPVIWEVLNDSSGCSVIFVAQSLESLTVEEHGPPLPGRRFSIENTVQRNPRVVVAAVIADGPVPMGPIVHLRAGTFDVSALICRCMPAQVRHLTGSTTFQMESMSQIQPFLDKQAGDDSARATWALAPGAASEGRLREVLRLPSHF